MLSKHFSKQTASITESFSMISSGCISDNAPGTPGCFWKGLLAFPYQYPTYRRHPLQRTEYNAGNIGYRLIAKYRPDPAARKPALYQIVMRNDLHLVVNLHEPAAQSCLDGIAKGQDNWLSDQILRLNRLLRGKGRILCHRPRAPGSAAAGFHSALSTGSAKNSHIQQAVFNLPLNHISNGTLKLKRDQRMQPAERLDPLRKRLHGVRFPAADDNIAAGLSASETNSRLVFSARSESPVPVSAVRDHPP